jgi:4-amino-4-deoxy-L-arabinose transferase-like glycosyltransferase
VSSNPDRSMPPDEVANPAEEGQTPSTAPEAGTKRLSHVKATFNLAEGQRVRITVEALPPEDGEEANSEPPKTVYVSEVGKGDGRLISAEIAIPPLKPQLSKIDEGHVSALAQPIEAKPTFQIPTWKGITAQLRQLRLAIPRSLEAVLFSLSLLVYLSTRLTGLTAFPIYFFTDEAVHTNLASDLVQHGFRFNGQFLPTYFPMGSAFGLNSVSVYLQVLPYLAFGKSIFVTRAVSVFVTVLAAIAIGLILRDIFKIRYWWAGTLLLSITPVWFLHSRTAFENVEVASFYAVFLYFYLRYRQGAPRALYAAIIFGALTFYTHGLGQILMGVTAFLFLISDISYHWTRRATLLRGLLLGIILALPYLRFAIGSASIFEEELRQRGSFWTDQALSLTDKLVHFGSEYLYGLSPGYWYAADNGRDLARHVMKGYGNLLWITLPFILTGLLLVLRNIKSPYHRTVLLALLASPAGAASVEVGALRVIWLVIPATILTTLGLAWFLDWLGKWHPPYKILTIILFAGMVGINFYMLRDALVNGPLWFRDYGLYGMQYGAKQLFAEAIPEYTQQHPEAQVLVSPNWANGTDVVLNFFFTPEQQKRVRTEGIDSYFYDKLPVQNQTVFVLTPPEYERVNSSPKFTDVSIEETIPYPDGTPGFYFTHLAYSKDADKIFTAEEEARRQPVKGQIVLNGQAVQVSYSKLDMGQLQDAFDGNVHTLMRGEEANPFTIEFTFTKPRPISGLAADFGSMDFSLTIELFPEGGGGPLSYTNSYHNIPGDPHVEMHFDNAPASVAKMRIEIQNLLEGDRAHIHIRELKLLP